jgi:ABC-2 type transport system permease protein
MSYSQYIKLKGTLRGELRVILSTAVGDLKIYYRYPANLLWIFTMPIGFTLIAYLISGLIDQGMFFQASGGASSLTSYVLSGWALYFLGNFAYQMGYNIEGEVVRGTLEPSFLAPIPRISFILGMTLSRMLSSSLFSLVLVAIGFVLFGRSGEPSGFIGAFLIFLLCLAVFFGVGVIMSGFSLRYKQIGALANLFTFLFQFLTGIIIPIRIFPQALRYVAYCIPDTWAIDAFRSTLLGIEPLVDIRKEVVLLIVLAVVFNLLGYKIFSYFEKKTKEDGTLTLY